MTEPSQHPSQPDDPVHELDLLRAELARAQTQAAADVARLQGEAATAQSAAADVLRAALRRFAPDLPAALLHGDTVASVEQAYAEAQAAVAAWREQERARLAATIPTATPARGAAESGDRSPMDLIRSGLARRSR